jgi:hypothetical protein
MHGWTDVSGCCKIVLPCCSRGDRYRRLDFEDDLAYDYESFELDPTAIDAEFEDYSSDGVDGP